MKLLPRLVTLFILAATSAPIYTQTASPTQFTDPANLRGERVKPRDGRELPLDQGASGLQQLLRKLNTRASILNIVAHPDDEDGGMMAFYSRGLGARVADISLTRGEGGQNAMTGDFEDALGLLRTQELLSSDRYPGIDQFFGTEVDFGFSKTKEEAFNKWTHERVLYDVVRAIRLYRPLVLTSTWIGGVTDGHGQHQVSGEIAQEAFNAAGDPKVFPDMIAEGILPWQPLKVYARVPTQSVSDKGLYDYATGQYMAPRFVNYVTGEVSTTVPSVDVVVHEGVPDPMLTEQSGGAGSSITPLTYVQFARLGLGQQKSQIPAGFRMPPPGAVDVSYHLYGSKLKNQPKQETGFFDGVDTSLLGIQNLDPAFLSTDLLHNISRALLAANQEFNPHHPELTAPLLATALKDVDLLLLEVEKNHNGNSIERADVLHELRIKRVQLDEAIALALGTSVEATAEGWDLVQNQKATVSVAITAGSDAHIVSPASIRGPRDTSAVDTRIHDNKDPRHPVVTSLTLDPLHDTLAYVTVPYFHRDNTEQPVYQLADASLRNAPSTPPALTAWSSFEYRNTTYEVGHVVTANLQPVAVVPILAISVRPAIAMISTRDELRPVHLTATAITNLPTVKPSIELSHPENWTGRKTPQDKTSPQSNDEVSIDTSILPTGITGPGAHPVAVRFFAVDPSSRKYTDTSLGYRSIGYAPLPRTNFYTVAETRFVPVDLNLPTKHRIAYLPGTGDAVPEALSSIGLTPTMLTVADLTPSKLAKFDTVILGVRTYAAHPDLHGAPTQALLDYAKSGGNVVVQYQTAEFTADDAPYPLTLGHDAEKVVDETAPVKLLLPAQPGTAPGGIAKDTPSTTPTMEYALLNTPNTITSADFNGWVEERGHGFLRTWDPHYAALTETHDPGSRAEGVLPQEPQRGGLITTPLGRGRWTYCAFALYRQLPEAVPGAFRLFVNLINP